MVGGGRSLLRENSTETDPPLQKRRLPINRYLLVAPQPSAPYQKSSINTNRKSITSFTMSLRYIAYAVSKT